MSDIVINGHTFNVTAEQRAILEGMVARPEHGPAWAENYARQVMHLTPVGE